MLDTKEREKIALKKFVRRILRYPTMARKYTLQKRFFPG